MLDFLARHSIKSELPVLDTDWQKAVGGKIANGAVASLKKARASDNPCSWLLALARCDVIGCSSNELARRVGPEIASNTITGLEGGKVNLSSFSHPISALIRYFLKLHSEKTLTTRKNEELGQIVEALLDLTEQKYASDAPTEALVNRWRYQFGVAEVQRVSGIDSARLSLMALNSTVLQPDALLNYAVGLKAIAANLAPAEILAHPEFLRISDAYRKHALLVGRPEPLIDLEIRLAACGSALNSSGIAGKTNLDIPKRYASRLLAYQLVPFVVVRPIVGQLKKNAVLSDSDHRLLQQKWKAGLESQPGTVGEELSLRAQEMRLEPRELTKLLGLKWESKSDSMPVRNMLVWDRASAGLSIGALCYLLARDEADLKDLTSRFHKQEDLEAKRKFSIVRTNLYRNLKFWNVSASDLGLDPKALAVLALTQGGPLRDGYDNILARVNEIGALRAKAAVLNWLRKFNSPSYLDYLKLAVERTPKADLARIVHTSDQRMTQFLAGEKIPSLRQFSGILVAAGIPELPEALISWHQATAEYLSRHCNSDLERLLRGYLRIEGRTITAQQKARGWRVGQRSPIRRIIRSGLCSDADFERYFGSISDQPWSALAVRDRADMKIAYLYKLARDFHKETFSFMSDPACHRELSRGISPRDFQKASLEDLFRLKSLLQQLYLGRADLEHPTIKRAQRVRKIITTFPGIGAQDILELEKEYSSGKI